MWLQAFRRKEVKYNTNTREIDKIVKYSASIHIYHVDLSILDTITLYPLNQN